MGSLRRNELIHKYYSRIRVSYRVRIRVRQWDVIASDTRRMLALSSWKAIFFSTISILARGLNQVGPAEDPAVCREEMSLLNVARMKARSRVGDHDGIS